MIHRLIAHVSIDTDPEPALAEARAAAAGGDDDLERWLDEYERGTALLVRITTSLEFSSGDENHQVQATNHGVFLERHRDAPKVEQEVAEVVAKDYGPIAGACRRHGHPVTEDDLDYMYVHVELGGDARRALTEPPGESITRTSRYTARASEQESVRVDDG